jgi:hypothetical protein
MDYSGIDGEQEWNQIVIATKREKDGRRKVCCWKRVETG